MLLPVWFVQEVPALLQTDQMFLLNFHPTKRNRFSHFGLLQSEEVMLWTLGLKYKNRLKEKKTEQVLWKFFHKRRLACLSCKCVSMCFSYLDETNSSGLFTYLIWLILEEVSFAYSSIFLQYWCNLNCHPPTQADAAKQWNGEMTKKIEIKNETSFGLQGAVTWSN